MLKKKSGLFLGLVVLAGSACVTPTHASSAPQVVISHIQAGSASSPLSELVVIHNNSALAVDVSGWCITNKGSVKLACVAPGSNTPDVFELAAHSSILFASASYVSELNIDVSSLALLYLTTPNQSSGGIVGSADTISLVDDEATVIDSRSWSTSLSAGKLQQRNILTNYPLIYENGGSASDWYVGPLVGLPMLEPAQDVDSGEGDDELVDGNFQGSIPEASVHPVISEILPNPSGADTDGAEYIELFNPTAEPIALREYSLAIGPQLEREYSFPVDALLKPGFTAFTNSDVKYTLVNTTSGVQLLYKGIAVGEAVHYDTPPSGNAWALFGADWAYTNIPTPNLPNEVSIVESIETDTAVDSPAGSSTALKPCAPGQERNPETNRCRNVVVAASAKGLTPCKANQYRNPLTNRCISVASSASKDLTPCKDGQERSPVTNRCVTTKKIAKADYAVKEASIERPGEAVSWYALLGVVGLVAAITGYIIWEWRVEIEKGIRTVVKKFPRRVN